MGHTFQEYSIFSIYFVMAGWIAEMLWFMGVPIFLILEARASHHSGILKLTN